MDAMATFHPVRAVPGDDGERRKLPVGYRPTCGHLMIGRKLIDETFAFPVHYFAVRSLQQRRREERNRTHSSGQTTVN